MPLYMRCDACDSVLETGQVDLTVDEDRDVCLQVIPCETCIEKARQNGIASVEMSVKEKEASKPDAEPTTEAPETTEAEENAIERLRRAIATVDQRYEIRLRHLDGRLRAAESSILVNHNAVKAHENPVNGAAAMTKSVSERCYDLSRRFDDLSGRFDALEAEREGADSFRPIPTRRGVSAAEAEREEG